ncbi:Rrf2 family transcriptional regulator [Oceanihabitans sediminis]|uniref:Rrf2 family transcriptional regulator n=1 Tax=Oceanihabitans sediminis TaxID=1812012 RepID=A0A368P4Q0_9FLAO|nr:Rrf2 family transcriptional regulator [Oceanihabitans sediminis]MDX1278259.1 Rrf2 family transcriptional regulator [Oceanihabitans sediminis]MDX1774597.1 Rrf2 family transcriptional regulator [Oceanihabitans sediminis]RBP29006.1 BadM/Rrf2 family transcriptional regulator [Oceanihabitans sediminis]RCU57064.1 Rrf2 family transcriptional regulator [Oceanihabitans sediminis]
MFSKACEYGIRASIFIAKNSYEGRRVSPKEISEEINSPQAFTAKILQALVKNNLINSVKGAYGGFEIEKDKIAAIKLSHIVKAIDGDNIYNGCGLGLETCDENHPCPVHYKFKEIRDGLKEMLESTNLEELALDIKTGIAFLKTY